MFEDILVLPVRIIESDRLPSYSLKTMDIEVFNENIYEKITSRARELVHTTNEIQSLYGIPIINKRISVTPIAIAAESCKTPDFVSIAKKLISCCTFRRFCKSHINIFYKPSYRKRQM